MTLVWHGVKEFSEAISRIEEKMLAAARTGTGEAAEFVRAEAQARVDAFGGTGAIGASVTVDGPISEGIEWTARVGPTAPGSRRVELGYKGDHQGKGHNVTGPHAFLKPVVETAGSRIGEIYKAGYTRAYRP